MYFRLLFVIAILPLVLFLTGCDNDPYCPEGTSWCWAQCVDLMSDNENCGQCDRICEPGWDCVDGNCKDPCEDLLWCNTHFCPATGTFECSHGWVDLVYCTCPDEGGCDYDRPIENCAYPTTCACDSGECIKEFDCPFGLVCTGEGNDSCECATTPLGCINSNRTCDEIAQDLLEFHEENSTCVDDWDCRTIQSYFSKIVNVCCFTYLSIHANAGILIILESQLMWHDDPDCEQYVIDTCCMAPPPLPRCVDGKCGP